MKIHIYPKSMLETVWQQDKLLFTPEAEQPPLCLRCGQPLDCRLVINAPEPLCRCPYLRGVRYG